MLDDIKELIAYLIPYKIRIRLSERSANMPRGSIYCVRLDDRCQRFLQYVEYDNTVGAAVIRVFKKKYPADYMPDPEQIANDEVDFYAETWSVPKGVIDKVWYKVGRSKNVGDTKNIMFRCRDRFDRETMKSTTWYVWKINKKRFYIGELTDEYRKETDLGYILPYSDIIDRIKIGKYQGLIFEVQ